MMHNDSLHACRDFSVFVDSNYNEKHLRPY